MIGADSTAVAWLVAVAEMIIAISFAASVIVVGRYLEAKRAPAARGSHRRWPDAPQLGAWPPPDPADRVAASTSELVAEWEAGGGQAAPSETLPAEWAHEPKIREHVHDFLGAPCWCGWGEKIVPATAADIDPSPARPYTAAADWPTPPGPADSTDIIYQAGWSVPVGEAAADA